MTIEMINDAAGLKRIEGQWDDLLERSANRDVLHSHLWYSSWSEAFVPPGDILVFAARDRDRITAVLPLMKGSYGTKGLTVRTVRSMTNRRSGLFDLLSDRPSAGLLAALLGEAFKRTNRRMMVLEKVWQDSLIMKHIEEAAAGGRLLYLARPVSEAWTIGIDAPFETFFNGRESKFKKNMRAAERKSLGRGPLRVSQPSGAEDLDEYLDRGFALQSNGWKGRAGSAITQDEQVVRFYRTLAARGLAAGWLRYMLMSSNGDDMSFMYCLGAYGTIHALEIGMDERFRNIGAGMVVTKKMLEQAFGENRFHLWDFGEGQDRWKKDWSNGRQLNYKVFIFPRTPVGLLLHALARRYDSRHPFRPFGPAEANGEGRKSEEEVQP